MKTLSSRPVRVLVVDDDEDATVLMGILLRTHGYRVAIAHNGSQAIERSSREDFDLVLLDLRMPFFSGFWFCDALKLGARTKKVPVIIVSSLPPEENAAKALQVGAAAYVQKPFRSEELLRMIERVLA